MYLFVNAIRLFEEYSVGKTPNVDARYQQKIGNFLPSGKKDADGFEINLRSFLQGKFLIGADIFTSVEIVVFQYKSQDVCFVDVEPSDVAFVLKNDSSEKIFEFHVREGGNSPPKTITEFLKYWPRHLQKMRKNKLEFWS